MSYLRRTRYYIGYLKSENILALTLPEIRQLDGIYNNTV